MDGVTLFRVTSGVTWTQFIYIYIYMHACMCDPFLLKFKVATIEIELVQWYSTINERKLK